MLALMLVTLFSPDAEACSPPLAEPETAYPGDGAVHVGIDQPLQVQFSEGQVDEQVIRVVEVHTETELVGQLSYLCPSSIFSSRGCILTFEPEGGGWPEDSEIQWFMGPEWSFETEDADWGVGLMSGSFSTSGLRLEGSVAEDLSLDGVHTHWQDESMCYSGEILFGDFELSGHVAEAGALVQLMASVETDRDDSLPEERTVDVYLVEEAGSFSLVLESQIEGTRDEVCYSARVFSADGLDYAQVEGPCLKWAGRKAGSGVSRCSTLVVHDPLSTTWLGLLGLVAFWRRQRR